MRDWVYGFFMAWGMFLAIPCPKKLWIETARRKMLVCLPLVGLLVGGIWAGAWLLLRGAPGPVRAAVCAAVPWLVTGFMHLDGYMDVCDAVLSRRDLPTRRRILKDSHCGAFAVICLALLVLCQWAVFLSAEALPLWPLTLIPAASRACAALAVLTLRPMSTSQYSAMTRGGAPVVFAAIVLAAVCGLSVLLWDSFAPLAAAVCYWLAAWYAFRQLDGMSGDVSGFALTIAELGGAAVLVLWR